MSTASSSPQVRLLSRPNKRRRNDTKEEAQRTVCIHAAEFLEVTSPRRRGANDMPRKNSQTHAYRHMHTHTYTHTHTSGHTHNISAGSQGTKSTTSDPLNRSRRQCAHNRKSTEPWQPRTSGGKQERQAYPHTKHGPKTVRDGPREQANAIALLPIFMHPAGCPETHANQGPSKSEGFPADVELRAFFCKRQRGQNNCGKTKKRPRIFHNCFNEKRRPTTQTRKGKRDKRMHGKLKNHNSIKGAHDESRHEKNPLDARK